MRGQEVTNKIDAGTTNATTNQYMGDVTTSHRGHAVAAHPRSAAWSLHAAREAKRRADAEVSARASEAAGGGGSDRGS